jgi:hypothetical protein
MSSRMMKMVFAVAAVSFSTAAMPAAASATAEATVTKPGPEPERASQMRAEAEAFFSHARHWRRAARLLERSAELRPPEDSEAYSSLMIAGSLRAARHEYNAAQANYEQAAAHAAARGAVPDQAHALINAAHAAVLGGYGDQAVALVQRARLLTASPMLTEAEKQQILRRLAAK